MNSGRGRRPSHGSATHECSLGQSPGSSRKRDVAEDPANILDAHVHVWSDNAVAYPFAPHDGIPAPSEAFPGLRLSAAMNTAGIAEALAIQPRVYGYDHAYLFAAAKQLRDRLRVMPLINVARPSNLEEMETLAARAPVAGFRAIVFRQQQAAALLTLHATHLWARLIERDLPLGLLIEPERLPVIETLAERQPNLSIVVDHLAGIHAADWPQWGPVLLRLSRRPNVNVKISALGHLSELPFPYDDLHGAVRQLMESYGAKRLLWGSDWPHAYGYGTYEDSYRSVVRALNGVSHNDRNLVLGGTARSLFGFPAPRPR